MTEAGRPVVHPDWGRGPEHLAHPGPGEEEPGEVLQQAGQRVHLDIEAASDVGAPLQLPGVLQQHAAVQRDVQLLGGEEHVHEVHVARAGYDEKLGTEPLRLFPLTPESADVTQRLGHGAGQEALTVIHCEICFHHCGHLLFDCRL